MYARGPVCLSSRFRVPLHARCSDSASRSLVHPPRHVALSGAPFNPVQGEAGCWLVAARFGSSASWLERLRVVVRGRQACWSSGLPPTSTNGSRAVAAGTGQALLLVSPAGGAHYPHLDSWGSCQRSKDRGIRSGPWFAGCSRKCSIRSFAASISIRALRKDLALRGLSKEPSDGLEPSTPSLPWVRGGDWPQRMAVEMHCSGWLDVTLLWFSCQLLRPLCSTNAP
jgi:hypothetical protein